MKDARMMTTHKTTIELIKEGKIKMVKPKDKPYSQIDYLVINEENEFIKIYNTLSEIEHIMNIVIEPIRIRDPDRSKPDDFDLANAVHKIVEDLQGTFEEATPILIQELLSISNNKIDSEKDKQILHSRILQLQQKFMEITGEVEVHTISQKLGFYNARLGHVYSESPFFTRVKKIEPDFLNECDASARKFERVLENFKNRFLIESEQKTAEPHEKSS